MKVSRYLMLLFSLLTMFFGNGSHPFYFGWVEVEVKNQRIFVHMKVFSDDLEACLRKKHPEMDILNDAPEKTAGILASYVKKNFSVHYGSVDIPLQWEGFRLEDEMCHMFLSGHMPSNSHSTVRIQCTLLFDGIPHQTHILKFKNEKNSQTYFLKISQPYQEIDSD